jgi:hypothetical protein
MDLLSLAKADIYYGLIATLFGDLVKVLSLYMESYIIE